ncbi:MAG: site-specific integrase [Desulfobacterales bacterium]|nr:site-specific integrase [Desulfobacterales bacterium]
MKRQSFAKEKTKENLLTDIEVDQLKGACQGFIDIFLVSMLLYTGMRVSELIHMRQGWIDWEMKLIRIPREQACSCSECKREFRNKKGKVTKPSGVWMPKTPDAIRSIPIVPELEDLLQRYLREYETVREIIPSRGAAYYRLRRISRYAEIGHPVFPHALRGTFATILARKQFTSSEMMSTMGWKSIAAADSYIKLSGAAVKQAFKKKW